MSTSRGTHGSPLPRTYTAAPEPAPPRWPLPPLIVALLLLALGGVSSWAANREIDGLLAARSAETLDRTAKVLDWTLKQQQAALGSVVGVLADDTRVRAAVMTPEFSEASVRDTLEDLKKASGASVLAVLDLEGKVRAVTGADELLNVNLGSSSAVQKAVKQPTTYVWTFPSQVLVIGIAAIHSGAEPSALFMIGYALGGETLGALHEMMGVDAAVSVGDRLSAATTKDSATVAALKAATALDPDRTYVVPGDAEHFARLVKTGPTTAAAKVVLVADRQEGSARAALLRALAWAPGGLGLIACLLVISILRRGVKGGLQ